MFRSRALLCFYRTVTLSRSTFATNGIRRTAPSCFNEARRTYSDAAINVPITSQKSEPGAEPQEGWLWVDAVFPIRLGTWDLRYYIGYLRQETLLERLRDILSNVETYGFRVIALEPHVKDGGVFVKFQYTTEKAREHGGVPSWYGLPRGNIWLVQGKPWREDLKRYASPTIKVAFDGPDVPEESLYALLRPYGLIQDLTQPGPVPPGTLRSSLVIFRKVQSATIARNSIHGASVPISPTSKVVTTLRTSYQQPIEVHAIRDYITSHPRIFLPVLLFLLGTLTYTIFDPIRIFMVEGKMQDWFDYREFRIYKWLRTNAFDKFSLASISNADDSTSMPVEGVWQERIDAEETLEKYLSDIPNTVAFVHGPQGSGKTRMINAVLTDTGRKAITIDVTELTKATSEMALVSGLAQQTGYWPVFSFLNSMNNLIDMASVGIIGQKAGLSSSLTDQLKQILEVVGTGLARVNSSNRANRERRVKEAHFAELQKEDEERLHARIREGRWHDGRLDCVAGNGIMSELGVGDERFTENDADADKVVLDENELELEEAREKENLEEARRQKISAEDLVAVESMPIVIIQNFESKGGGSRREELMSVLAQWAATLAENKVAHVVVVSDNRENAKTLAKALPSKPLSLIALSDADNASALSFVKQKLHDVGVEVEFTPEQTAYVERLGGRASDLERLIHKVRNGQLVEEAVEDIITGGVSELRKNAFGDDVEDSKNLQWTREQAWILMKQLSKQPEISYHEVLLEFPFKGDEAPLRSMEHAELIAIVSTNGRPSTIRAGKPVYRYVFERLVEDSVFRATQDIAFNEKAIAASETIVKACEQELITLKDVDAGTSSWWGSNGAVEKRGNYLLKKMRAAEDKIETLDKQNVNLKKVLSKGN
ncbi:Mitochondrial escape protein 2 [Grifola frondosa]|uniref:Mitochondrial escape protein 2 n=1 Tax=Grifola frondosa TaxID=5627 RepID=A0A1C7MFT3_GRIFR|nr:Mitochondrial escape protein 2 [Grifola frondosa]